MNTAVKSESARRGPEPVRTWRAGTITYTRIGLVMLFFWLLFGDFAWAMRDRSVISIAGWYLEHLKVSNVLYGFLLSSFPALIGLIFSPIVSVKSDRHRGRWGRRIPFLLIMTPIAASGMIGLAVTPYLAKWVHSCFPHQSEMVISVICFGVFWAIFEFASIAIQAIFNGLINDVVPVEVIGRFFGLFRAVSLIDGMIFNYWIMGHVPNYFAAILILIALFYISGFMWMCFKVKEGDYPPPSALKSSRESRLANGFFEARAYFRESFTKPYYVVVFTMFMTANLAFAPVNTFAWPYAHSLGLNMDVYGKFLALTYLISLSLSFLLGWLSDLFHPLRVAMVSLTGYFIVAAWGSIFADTPATFLTAWIAHGVLSGCFFTSSASLGQRLYPKAKFAQYASAGSIFMSIGSMALAPSIGMIVDRTGNIYQYTFLSGCVLALVGLGCGFYVYRQFIAFGGPEGYVAPES